MRILIGSQICCIWTEAGLGHARSLWLGDARKLSPIESISSLLVAGHRRLVKLQPVAQLQCARCGAKRLLELRDGEESLEGRLERRKMERIHELDVPRQLSGRREKYAPRRAVQQLGRRVGS